MKSILLYSICFIFFICDFQAVSANTYEVLNVNNTGAGSFRQAITDANANTGADTINFNISGTGPFSIILASALPNITGPTVINGTTQPGFVSGTQATYVKVGTAYNGTIFTASNVTGLTIKGLDLSYATPRVGTGITLTTCFQSFILDNFIRNRSTGITINGGQDHTMQNNDMLASGQDINQPAIYLQNITQGSITSGVAMSGNKFGGNANQSFRITNMSNLIIGDASVVGANIIIEDNSGLGATGNGGQYVMYLTNVNNVTIDNIDMSWLGGGQIQSSGIVIDNSVTNSTIIIKNCALANRWEGIRCTNGKDYTIQNNDLRGVGENAQFALALSNITAATIPGGVLISGNLYGRSTTGVESKGGLKMSNMDNLTIGDAATGVQIKIEDNSGFNKINGNSPGDRGALFLQNVSNIIVDNVDASWTLGGITACFGIRINNSGSNGNITIKNCDVRNHYLGIACVDGKDYSIFNNDLRGSGHEDNAALHLNSIGEGTILGGVLVHTNLYGRNPTGPIDPNSIGLYIAGMSNLTIGDATTGVQIKIEDNSGMNTFGGNTADRRGMLYLDDVSNITVDDIDVSYTLGGIPNSFGIYVENETSRMNNIPTSHRNVIIKNCLARNRSNGIRVRGGKDYTIFNNDLRGSGHNNYFALELANIQAGTLPTGVLVYSNLYGTNGAQVSNSGVSIQYMNDLMIGDATTGVSIKLEDNSGLNQIAGADQNNQGVLYLAYVNNSTVDNVDCSKVPAGQGNSWGIRFVNSTINSNITIKNCLAGNRNKGIWIDGGKDYTVTNNNLVSSGSGNGAAAMELSNIIPGSLAGGILASGNTFGTPTFNRGVAITGMRNLLIGDASVVGANIVLEDNSGLNQCVGADYNNQGALFMSNVDSVIVDNVDCSKVTAGQGNSYGIYVSNGILNQSVTIKNCKTDNRARGINCRNGKDYTVQNNTITNSGSDGEACALDFRDVTAGTLTGGVLVSGNTFGNSPISANVCRAAVRFDNMRDLTIGDATTGVNVKLEDGSGLTAVGYDANSNYSVIALNNVYNSSIDNIELSSAFTTPAQRNLGIKISNNLSNGTITVKDCNIQNRRTGLYINGGKDYTVTGNNVTGCGNNSGEPAIWLNSIVKGSLDGGIAMSANTFGGTNANTALRIDDMRGFTIGDNAIDDIFLDNATSGLMTVGNVANSNDFVFYLNQISDVAINNVEMSRSGGSQLAGGIRIINGNGNNSISLTNNNINNRRTGIFITGGIDYTLTGNTLTGSGLNISEPAIYLNGLLEGSLTGGLSMNTNTFGGTNANSAVRFENMKNLTIGDASVSGTNVVFEDATSGLATTGNNANSNDPVFYFVNVANSSIDNVDLTRTGATQYGVGIRVDNNASSNPFAIKNCAVGKRRTGIYINGTSGYTIYNNDITGSGAATSEPALYILNTTFVAGKSIYDNTFGGPNFNTGLRLDNVNDLIIGNETVSDVQIELKSTSGIKDATTRAIDLETCNRIKIELIQLSLTGTASGTGLYINGGSHVTAKSLTIQKRVDAIDIVAGASHTVQCSDLSLNTDALQIALAVTGLTVEQNTFVGNTGYAIQSAATIKAENNYFGGGAPPVGLPPNAVTATTDVTPFLSMAPSGCPSSTAPEIEVIGNLNLVEDNSVTPSTLNFTDFNSVKNGSNTIRTFKINNIGGTNLNITSIGFSGTNAADFVASALIPASPIPAGSAATFIVTFTPGATGARTATLEIVNDDFDEAAFDAAIKGTGKDVILVTNTLNSGAGSLRQAITDANVSSDADVIEFAIGTGAQTIINTGVLPTITSPLIIDGSSQPGFAGTPLITINSNSSFASFNASGVTGLTIKYLDLSRPDANWDGDGIIMTNCNEVFILNNKIQKRRKGVFSNGGRDHVIKDNDFKSTGYYDGEPAVYLSSLTSRNIPGGIQMSGNVWGYNPVAPNNWNIGGCPLRIDNMNGLVIGDASVSGANIVLEDGTSGLDKTGYNVHIGESAVLYFSNVSDLTIDNIDFTHIFPGPFGYGPGRAISINNNAGNKNITVKNCKMQFRSRGIDCNDGFDYTLQDNDIRNTGNGDDDACIRLNAVKAKNILGGVIATGNIFGVLGGAGGNTRVGTALKLTNMSDLIIGDASVSGANIVIPDGELNDFKGHDPYCCYRSIFSFNNVSNIVVDNVDLTSTTQGYIGYAINISNSTNNKNVTIKNCAIQSRVRGIYINGGKDYTLTNNDLRNTGNSTSDPAIYLSGIRPGSIPAGISASLNKFGFVTQTAATALRIDGMDGVLIGDAGVVGANIVIEDNSGANSMNNSDIAAVIYLNGVSNITVDNVDVSRAFSNRDGTGIYVDNGSSTAYRNITIKNCKINQRTSGIWVLGGKDVTIKDNDCRYSGYYTDRPAIYLNNILSGVLPGGIDMSGNLFGGTFNGAITHLGLRIDNMRDLFIGNASVVGRNITIEDASGMNNVIGEDVNNRGCIYMNSVRNVQIKNVDMSKAPAGQGSSFALFMNNGINVLVQNCKGSNRQKGFQFSGGRDISVLNNDLDSTGVTRDNPALWFSGITPQTIPGGVSASGNIFGGANVRTALRLDGMKDLIIGDASVSGANIVIEDGSGMNNMIITDNNSDHPALYLTNMTNTTIDNIDASRAGTKDRGGIWVSNNLNNNNITIKNCNFNNHRRAIYCSGGRDYTIQNNTMLNGGDNNNEPAVFLQNIQSGSLPGGILMSNNSFGGTTSFGGLRIENMRDLIIGDVSVTGRNITLEDACGLNNMGGTGNNSAYYVMQLVNVNNATIDNVDLSRPVGATPAQDFTGIRIDNGGSYGPITIKNNDLRRHRTGINVQGGKDYTISGNDLRGCGANSDEPALYVNNITQSDGSIPMGLTASANQFGTANSIVSNCGIRLDNLCGIKITNIAGSGNHVVLNAADSIRTISGNGGNVPSVIALRNTSGVTIDSINFEWTGTQTGTAIYCLNDNASQYGNKFTRNIIKNRRLGIKTLNGSDYTIQDNDFQTTGIADDEPAIRMEHAAEGSLSGGVSISGNKFGGTSAFYGLKFVNMSNLKISDGTFVGTNVNLGLYGTNGLSEVAAGTGYVLHFSGVCNAEVNSLDLSRSGSTRQGTGIRLTNGMGNTIQKIYAQGRDIGLQVNGSVSETIKCNTFYDNNFGMDFITPAITGLSLINNSMMCNTTGIRTTAPGTLSASSNYWGAANGPTNLGGTGNGYIGTVNANSFLTAPDACANIVPNTDALGNNVLIEDGDITPTIDDGTLVCGIPIGQNLITNYTIKNNGGGIMRLIGPNPVTVVPATQFTVDSQPSDLELAPGESTNIGIKFEPTAIGQQNAIVNVANKSCDNNPYNFTIQGNGCNPSTAVMSRDTAICIGKPGSVKLTITGGTAPFTVTLSDGSVHTLNANGVNYITRTPVTTTTYSVTKIYDANNCCADFSGASMITVNTLPTTTISVVETSGNVDNDGILCSGDIATLDGGIFSEWLWSTSATSQTINTSAAGTYIVTVTDVNGCTATDDYSVTVNPNPSPTITVTETSGNTPNDGILCQGDMATLNAGTYTSYVWSTSAITQSINATTSATYIVTVTNTDGCLGTDAQVILVHPLPTASLNNALVVCPGITTVMLDINITAGSAPWTVILSDASSHNIASSGISQIAVTVDGGPSQNTFTITSIVDANGCSGIGTGLATVDFASPGEIELKGNNMTILDGDTNPDPSDHTDFGQTTSAPITRTFTIKNVGNLDLILLSGAITFTGTNAGLFTVNNISLPANISGPNGSLSFDVTYTPLIPGIHTATVNIANSDCDESPYDFAVKGEFVCSPPSITSCPNSTIIVSNDAGLCNAVVAYNVTANGTPAPTFSYVFTGATTGSGSGTGSNSTFLKGNTLVTVTASNPCGAPTCIFTITVNDTEKPVITRLGAATIELCKNDSYTDAGATAIDNCDGNLTSSISTVNPVNTTIPATYTVTYNVSDLAGNAAIQMTRTVIVHDLPAMTCPSDFDACKTAGNITLSGATPSGGIYSGSGVSGGIFDPIAAGIGAHIITYTFTDGFGCIGTCTFVITVFDPPIYNVNDNMYFCTLAEAVAASLTNDGDELQIPFGVYNDPCIVINKSVMITSVGGAATIQCLQMNGVGKAMKLGGDIIINQLTLTNGNVRTNGNNLKCGSVIGGSAGSYVITD